MIVFSTPGHIPLESFTVFGMSAKPGSDNPIGKFGTGLKNAVAITLRLGGKFLLFIGETEYQFYTKAEDFRGKQFERVRMRKRRGFASRWTYDVLPYTTELGQHWEPWMSLRELEANTRDEGGESAQCRTWVEASDGYIEEGRTTIIVDCREYDAAWAEIDKVFLPKSEPFFEDVSVKIIDAPSDYLYYRGMRVFKFDKPSAFTYDLTQCELTEDRTTNELWFNKMKIKKALLGCDDREKIERVVKAGEAAWEGSLDWDASEDTTKASAAWHDTLTGYTGSGRYGVLRDNLTAGIPSSTRLSLWMTAGQWQNLADAIEGLDMAEEGVIRKMLKEKGYKGAGAGAPPVSSDPYQDLFF